MNGGTDPIIASLEAFVPPFEEADGEWEAVLAKASLGSFSRRTPAAWRNRRRWGTRVTLSRRLLVTAAVVLVVLGAGSAIAATAWPPSKTNPVPPATQPPLPARVSSIQVIHESPMPGAEFGANNVWQGPVGGVWVLAYAGAYNKSGGADTSSSAPLEPAMALWSEPVDPNAPSQSPQLIGVYPAPGPETSVEITGANGSVLSLTGVGPGADGQSFQFNIETRAYTG
jgi:hypothetical protein